MYQLAQINVARMKGININDPIMQAFVDNLESVNHLAESSPGFIWRLKDDDNNATSYNPFNDEQIIVNVSVWQDVPSLEAFTYKTFHTDFLKRRKEWFQKYGTASYALWWIKAGENPTVDDCLDRLKHLQAHGATEKAFTFTSTFEEPES